MKQEITVEEFAILASSGKKFTLLDVRTPQEWDIVNLGGKLIADYEITQRYGELDKDEHILVLCHHGVRSLNVLRFLQSQGFVNIQNIKGGIDAYALKIDPKLRRY